MHTISTDNRGGGRGGGGGLIGCGGRKYQMINVVADLIEVWTRFAFAFSLHLLQ